MNRIARQVGVITFGAGAIFGTLAAGCKEGL